MIIRDSMTLDASGLKMTNDGYLVGDAKVSRAGNVQQYLGSELGLTGDDAKKVFGVYRDPDTVFDESSMMSLAGRPVTRGHPDGLVDASNWKALAKGQIGGTIKRDGEHVVAPMAIMDAKAAKEVADGARSLSAGYTVQVVAGDGVAPDGTPYQYRQASPLRFNHVAYLPDNNPRAGNTRIGDDGGDGGIDRSTWGIRPAIEDKGASVMTDKTTQIVRDGLPVNLPDSAAPIINKWLADADKALKDKQTALDKALADVKAKDTELGEKDAEITKLKAASIENTDMDKLVADRAALVAKAKEIAPDLATDGVKDMDIRRAAVATKLGDEKVKDRSDDYITGLFDHLADDTKGSNPLSGAIKDSKPTEKVDWGSSVYDTAGVPMKKKGA